jgi:hypothetical protein
MNTLSAGKHVATLHNGSGVGILVGPSYDTGDHIGGHSDDWNTIVSILHSHGWGPLCDDWDLPITLAQLNDGGTIYALQAENSCDRASEADYDAALLSLIATVEV